MELALWILLPLLIIGLVVVGMKRLRARNSADVAAAISADAARAASSRLSGDEHREVYRALAQGNFMAGVQAYRAATGDGIKSCIIAVRSMEHYPQAFTSDLEPESDPISEALARERAHDAAGVAPVEAPAAERESSDLESPESSEAFVIPNDWTESFGSDAERTSTSFKVSYLLDGEAREFGSEDLPPAEHDQFLSLVRDGDLDGAGALIAKYSGLDAAEIRKMLEVSPLNGNVANPGANISDFSFDGDGPDGAVRFSVGDLPEPERGRFLEHLRMGRVDEATAIVARHTGLPEDMIRTLLTAFDDGTD
ncbi:hypothetical protein [Paeniglutamicibacter cryotolerans]|uniref:Uncharacterized protein n=1 Tax=Paeniglutamicibacter cryotolerans TaxID=670079 RepID=A0A839QHT5_9MICC|nr:hypothetical protein [Paeniglutamicibacter cryotolerans]MBB2995327.1 hypothetical protein [Paeniglutamicibacter cryotolerans]